MSNSVNIKLSGNDYNGSYRERISGEFVEVPGDPDDNGRPYTNFSVDGINVAWYIRTSSDSYIVGSVVTAMKYSVQTEEQAKNWCVRFGQRFVRENT